MKKIFITTLLILSNLLVAQVYTQATLYLKDGTKLQGVATIPSKPKDGSISFKEEMNSKSRKSIPSKTISKAIYTTIKMEKFVFERLATVYWKKNKSGEVESAKHTGEVWLWQYRSHKKLNLYLSYPEYKLTKEGDFKVIYYSNGVGSVPIGEGSGYYKRPNENVATTSMILTLSITKLLNHLNSYFSDVSEMKTFIQKTFKKNPMDLYRSSYLYEEYLKY